MPSKKLRCQKILSPLLTLIFFFSLPSSYANSESQYSRMGPLPAIPEAPPNFVGPMPLPSNQNPAPAAQNFLDPSPLSTATPELFEDPAQRLDAGDTIKWVRTYASGNAEYKSYEIIDAAGFKKRTETLAFQKSTQQLYSVNIHFFQGGGKFEKGFDFIFSKGVMTYWSARQYNKAGRLELRSDVSLNPQGQVTNWTETEYLNGRGDLMVIRDRDGNAVRRQTRVKGRWITENISSAQSSRMAPPQPLKAADLIRTGSDLRNAAENRLFPKTPLQPPALIQIPVQNTGRIVLAAEGESVNQSQTQNRLAKLIEEGLIPADAVFDGNDIVRVVSTEDYANHPIQKLPDYWRYTSSAWRTFQSSEWAIRWNLIRNTPQTNVKTYEVYNDKGALKRIEEYVFTDPSQTTLEAIYTRFYDTNNGMLWDIHKELFNTTTGMLGRWDVWEGVSMKEDRGLYFSSCRMFDHTGTGKNIGWISMERTDTGWLERKFDKIPDSQPFRITYYQTSGSQIGNQERIETRRPVLNEDNILGPIMASSRLRPV